MDLSATGFEVDEMTVIDYAVENGVGDGGTANHPGRVREMANL
jgi:hypothetical protein